MSVRNVLSRKNKDVNETVLSRKNTDVNEHVQSRINKDVLEKMLFLKKKLSG